ncbi:hypothetical protein R3P38DRAFT_2699987 [Favolaschia claudopus]|uniref:Uncharacterized protein n=1 Tax=Favolaschia claudopus TaxID=2862362 RepID=A0AAW0C1Q4_9AGAR
MASLTLSQGRLFGVLYEAILFGINFILFVSLLYLFFQDKRKSLSQRLRLIAICFLFSLCAAHLAIGMRGLYIAFFVEDLPPDTYYLDHTQPLDLIGKAVYAAATVVADSLLIYRAYTIFNGKWLVIVVPCLSVAATLAAWIASIRAYSQQAHGTTLFTHSIARLAIISFVMSFITNVIITIMIFLRIWLAMRRFRTTGISTSFYSQFLAFTVESGLIYPVALIIEGVFFALKNNGLEIVSGSNTQVLGIVPILLALQLRFNLSAYDSTAGTRNISTTLPTFRSSGASDSQRLDETELSGMDQKAVTSRRKTNTTSSVTGSLVFQTKGRESEEL